MNTRKQLAAVMSIIWAILAFSGGCSQNRTRYYRISPSPQQSQSEAEQPSYRYGPNNPAAVPLDSAPVNNKASKYAQNNAPGEAGPPQSQETALNNVALNEYHIGPGDILEIKVEQLLELNQETKLLAEVDRQGNIYLPLVNHIKVGGLTVMQVRQMLIHELGREYIRQPKVYVGIKEYHSKQVMVLGNVRKPGPVMLESDASNLLDVVAKAGGILPNAGPDIEILRGAYNPLGSQPDNINFETAKKEIIPRQRLFAQAGVRQENPVVYPGDVIKIDSNVGGYLYIAGEVKRPGSKIFHRPMTILQAITCAGGVTRIAAEKKCKIIRRSPEGEEKELVVNLKKIREGKQKNILMAQNDTIILPINPVKKFFNDLNQMFYRGVNAGVSVTYDAASEMGIPSGGSVGGARGL